MVAKPKEFGEDQIKKQKLKFEERLSLMKVERKKIGYSLNATIEVEGKEEMIADEKKH